MDNPIDIVVTSTMGKKYTLSVSEHETVFQVKRRANISSKADLHIIYRSYATLCLYDHWSSPLGNLCRVKDIVETYESTQFIAKIPAYGDYIKKYINY